MSFCQSSNLTPAILLNGDFRLPSTANLHRVLKRAMHDTSNSLALMTDIIKCDAGLAASLLRQANQATSKTNSIADALRLLGERGRQQWFARIQVMDHFADTPALQTTIHDLWAYNLRCALIARKLDLLTGSRFTDNAYLCGLLHNVGQVVLYLRAPDVALEIEQQVQATFPQSVDECQLERQKLGFDRYVIGAALCRLWQLPDVVSETIRQHHQVDVDSPYATLATLVRLAHTLSNVEWLDDFPEARTLGLNFDLITEVLDQIDEEFEVLFKRFYPVF